ncbi:hypothetical protein BST81_20880 [Leptolyngbya sp. 'hensonii']|uniref:GerMN domain-containing protein n=1 Tax=Leptolyngbya sp. 'hensonii' TaxID=1922337 RepID=UPI00094FE62A|nr:GerMN domain-containing protein [Leptolyngbya sp. 'hensonii']OLP16438.1 hypothetical protein BST81_20880 [Leptolyngbya sp. 'hensonii']
MNDRKFPRRPTALILGAGGIVLAAAGTFLAVYPWSNPNRVETPSVPTIAVSPSTQTAPSPQSTPEKPAQVYWLSIAGDVTKLVPTQVNLSASSKTTDDLKAAFDRLLAGPQNPDNVTSIPPGTTLRNLTMEGDNIRIDLSKEFTSGGGSASMKGRLAQVLYTATSIKPTAKVWISIEGKPLTTLGGEGLELEQPLTRQNFEENFPL